MWLEGWQYQMYEANQIDGTTLELTRFSPDGDQNFPGNVRAKVRFHKAEVGIRVPGAFSRRSYQLC